MDSINNEYLNDFKPWQTGLQNNTSVLKHLKKNLVKYQKNYNKQLVRQKPQLPKIKLINLTNKTRVINNDNKYTKQLQYAHQQLILNRSISLPKRIDSVIFRKRFCPTTQEKNNFNNFESNRSKASDCSVKKYLINFDQQNKYRRMRKREIHYLIFGQKSNIKTQNQELLDFTDA